MYTFAWLTMLSEMQGKALPRHRRLGSLRDKNLHSYSSGCLKAKNQVPALIDWEDSFRSIFLTTWTKM